MHIGRYTFGGLQERVHVLDGKLHYDAVQMYVDLDRDATSSEAKHRNSWNGTHSWSLWTPKVDKGSTAFVYLITRDLYPLIRPWICPGSTPAFVCSGIQYKSHP